MRRWLSILLALTLMISPATALAEEAPVPEAVSIQVEEASADALWAGDTGLTVELDAPEAIEATAEPEAAESPVVTPAPSAWKYVRVTADEAAIRALPGGEIIAYIARGDAALSVEGPADDLRKVAFDTPLGVVVGWTEDSALAELTNDETAALLDAAAAQAVALYQDDLDAPLPRLNARFPEAEVEETPIPEETPVPEEIAETPVPEETVTEEVIPEEAIIEEAPIAGMSIAGTLSLSSIQPLELIETPIVEETPAPEQLKVFASADGGLQVVGDENQLLIGRTLTLQVQKASGETLQPDAVAYESSDEAVLQVSELGVVTALSAGSAQIVASYEAITGVYDVTVPAEPTAVSLPSSATIGVKETWTGLAQKVVFAPAGSASTLTWRSSNTKIVKVDAATGAVYGVKAGSAYVYARTRGGKEAKCKVTVKKAPSKITLNCTSGKMGADGLTYQLKATLPSGTASARITYTSNNPDVATVSETGLITSVNAGAATITAKTFNGKSATCKLTVLASAASASFASETLELGVGQSYTPAVQVFGADGSATVARLTFSIGDNSANPDCITLNPSTGAITAKAKGSAVVEVVTHNGKASAAVTVVVKAAPAGITLNRTSGTIGVKETFRGLTATLTVPAGETETAGAITWRSSNTKYVKVDAATGAIYGVKAGSAYVYAKAYTGKEVKCKVTVKKAPSKVTLNGTTARLGPGMTVQLKATLPSGTASGAITFTSANPEIATVSDTGLITAVSKGVVNITAKAFNGKSATCKVTVTGEVVKAYYCESEITVGVSQTLTPAAALLDSDGDAALAICAYESSNPGVVTINATTGAIKAVAVGQAQIRFKTHNGVESQPLTVNVLAAPTSVKLYYNDALWTKGYGYVALGETMSTLTAQAQPANCYGGIAWRSSNTKYVKVDAATGKITGVKKGSAYVYARTYNGKEVKIKITVVTAPSKVTLNKTSVTLGSDGMTQQLTATVPSGSICSSYAYTTSNEAVAKVDEKGLITATGVGTAKVTVKTFNNKTATCTVTVKAAPTSVALSPAEASLSIGYTGQYEVSLPANCLANYTFSSSNETVATVNASGVVTAKSAGSATISVKTYNGLVAESKLTVTNIVNAKDSEKIEYIISVAQSKLGKPYVYGAFGPDKFDCSGFTYYCFKQAGITLKTSAYSQGYDDRFPKISDPDGLRRGDLVFFDTVSDSDLSDHAGIYLGDGYFIHASSGGGKVIVSSLKTGYYSNTYYKSSSGTVKGKFSWGRRVFN